MPRAYGIPPHAVNPLGARLRQDRTSSSPTTGTRARRRGVDRDMSLRTCLLAAAVPAGGLVEIYDWDAASDCYKGRKPTARTGFPIAVAPQTIAAGAMGQVAFGGEVPVLVAAAVVLGDWLGPTVASWSARVTCVGTLEVTKALAGAGLTRARFLPSMPPPMVVLTADPSAGYVTARWVDSSGTPSGDTETFIDASAW